MAMLKKKSEIGELVKNTGLRLRRIFPVPNVALKFCNIVYRCFAIPTPVCHSMRWNYRQEIKKAYSSTFTAC